MSHAGFIRFMKDRAQAQIALQAANGGFHLSDGVVNRQVVSWSWTGRDVRRKYSPCFDLLIVSTLWDMEMELIPVEAVALAIYFHLPCIIAFFLAASESSRVASLHPAFKAGVRKIIDDDLVIQGKKIVRAVGKMTFRPILPAMKPEGHPVKLVLGDGRGGQFR